MTLLLLSFIKLEYPVFEDIPLVEFMYLVFEDVPLV